MYITTKATIFFFGNYNLINKKNNIFYISSRLEGYFLLDKKFFRTIAELRFKKKR